MKRTTVLLPDDLDARVRLEARRRGVAVADVLREAVAQHVAASGPAGRLGFVAVGDGERADASERVDEFVGKAVARRRRPS
ncbi:ribbon-helix-helix domain-containing protein [Aciditerrimonas ferrireducens]|uniref:ribbon-helix-helix domain-containing protein n=1 Tax=Aciditerrimonas ferrireducens TaxID=667306 RepID=UPI0020038A99|nr:CopG family transcriptional regulator [Aciditerrimonas ferrireducens]MCK4177420.1 ribbon-helix-helix domain-containing protein [Aciditerrimonas ferrireducens]